MPRMIVTTIFGESIMLPSPNHRMLNGSHRRSSAVTVGASASTDLSAGGNLAGGTT